jgi:hypothetical protein
MIDIPLDDFGAPDLQRLVRTLGEQAAARRGEKYDPAHKPEHGGYQYMSPELWAAFDEAMKQYRLRLGDLNRGV